MIIFTTKEFEQKILEYREDRPTKIILFDLSQFQKELDAIESVLQNPDFRTKVDPEQIRNIEYNLAKYVLIMHLKFYFVNYVIENNLVSSQSDLVSWFDFGFVRDVEKLRNIKRWSYPFSIDKVHFFNIRKRKINTNQDVYDLIFNNKVFIIGGVIIASRYIWNDFYLLFEESKSELLKSNIIDDDQGVLTFCLFKRPSLFELHYLGKDNWFGLFERFDITSKVNLITKIKDFFK